MTKSIWMWRLARENRGWCACAHIYIYTRSRGPVWAPRRGSVEAELEVASLTFVTDEWTWFWFLHTHHGFSQVYLFWLPGWPQVGPSWHYYTTKSAYLSTWCSLIKSTSKSRRDFAICAAALIVMKICASLFLSLTTTHLAVICSLNTLHLVDLTPRSITFILVTYM